MDAKGEWVPSFSDGGFALPHRMFRICKETCYAEKMLGNFERTMNIRDIGQGSDAETHFR